MVNTCFQIIEEDSGKLLLAILDGNGNCQYLQAGFEKCPGQLRQGLLMLMNGGIPNAEGAEQAADPQHEYLQWQHKLIHNSESCSVIADNNGLYFERMRFAGMIEFVNLRQLQQLPQQSAQVI